MSPGPLPGSLPWVRRAGLTVAEVFASDEPESDLVMVAPETVGDVGEVSYDVIGLGDDSVRGFRVHVIAESSDPI